MSWLSKGLKTLGIGGAAQLAGAVLGASSADKDRKMQMQAAQNSIQWRVADAKAAGVHPLYALGAPTMSMSPVGDGGAGQNMAALGQDLSRAKMANMDRQERAAEMHAAGTRQAVADRMAVERHAADMRHSALEDDYLRAQIGRLNSAQLGPGNPALSTNVVPQPSRPFMPASPNNPGRQAGSITDYQFVRTPTGIGIVPSEDIANRFDEIPGQGAGWAWRNSVLPFFGSNVPRQPPASEFPLREGWHWEWNGTEFRPSRNGVNGRTGGGW